MINEVSIRYAKALYEVCKTKKNNALVFSELRVLDQVVTESPAIKEFITSPATKPEQKIETIKKILGQKFSEELVNTLLLMAEKNRLHLFSELVTAFEKISDDDHGVTRGTVRSTTQLEPEARLKIEETVNKVTGKKVILNFIVDSKILGGMVAQVGGWTFDDGLDSHLTRLSEDLNRRAN